jgi:putative two-component system response regulator
MHVEPALPDVERQDPRATYERSLEEQIRERTAELEARRQELEQAKLETLKRLALAAEYRDDETFEHTGRVGQMAAMLAEMLGLDPEKVRLMGLAAPLHDIGKLAIPDSILLKPGKLSADEFEQVKLHTTHGAAILSNTESAVLRLAEEIARTHHEWWDGSGYPDGLRGNKIPISGRIVAIADVFDALTHSRPYKEAWPVDDALDEINRLRGVQFDPAVVDAFNRLTAETLAA